MQTSPNAGIACPALVPIVGSCPARSIDFVHFCLMRKSVLITGGAKRVGKAICRAVCRSGLACCGPRKSFNCGERGALADGLPDAQVVQCDLGDARAAEAMVRELAAQLDDWRCLINNASIFEADHVTALDPAANARAMTINAATPALMAQAYLAHARSRAAAAGDPADRSEAGQPQPRFLQLHDEQGRRRCRRADAGDGLRQARTGSIASPPARSCPAMTRRRDEAERSHRLNLLQRRTGAEEVADAALFLAEGPAGQRADAVRRFGPASAAPAARCDLSRTRGARAWTRRPRKRHALSHPPVALGQR